MLWDYIVWITCDYCEHCNYSTPNYIEINWTRPIPIQEIKNPKKFKWYLHTCNNRKQHFFCKTSKIDTKYWIHKVLFETCHYCDISNSARITILLDVCILERIRRYHTLDSYLEIWVHFEVLFAALAPV